MKFLILFLLAICGTFLRLICPCLTLVGLVTAAPTPEEITENLTILENAVDKTIEIFTKVSESGDLKEATESFYALFGSFMITGEAAHRMKFRWEESEEYDHRRYLALKKAYKQQKELYQIWRPFKDNFVTVDPSEKMDEDAMMERMFTCKRYIIMPKLINSL